MKDEGRVWNPELVAALERERRGGMPRWNVPHIDTADEIKLRRLELLEAEAEWRASLPVQVVRARQPINAEEGAA